MYCSEVGRFSGWESLLRPRLLMQGRGLFVVCPTRLKGVGCRTALALVLLIFLGNLSLPASAFQFFGNKKTPAQNLPPAMRLSPRLPQPGGQTAPSSQSPNAEPSPPSANNPLVAPPSQGTPVVLSPKTPPFNPLHQLVEKGVFPEAMEAQDTPVLREQLAQVMVNALGYNTALVGEFPFYRDVLTKHPHYVPIEVAREKKLLTYPHDHGFYYPEKPVLYADAYQGIAHAITGPSPTPEMTAHLLQPFEDKESLSPAVQSAVAKMAHVRFFTAASGTAETRLHPGAFVTPKGLAPLVSYLMRVIELRSTVSEEAAEAAAALQLPAGLALTVTPSTAVFESQLTPGQTTYFSLVNAVDPLPKATRLQAVVREVQPPHTYILEINEARLPDGTLYQLQAPLKLTFPSRRRAAFMVPGQLFDVTTEASVDPNAPSTPGNTAPPPFSPQNATPSQLPAPKPQDLPPALRANPGEVLEPVPTTEAPAKSPASPTTTPAHPPN